MLLVLRLAKEIVLGIYIERNCQMSPQAYDAEKRGRARAPVGFKTLQQIPKSPSPFADRRKLFRKSFECRQSILYNLEGCRLPDVPTHLAGRPLDFSRRQMSVEVQDSTRQKVDNKVR